MNGLLDLLKELKNIFPGKFIITRSVKYETIDRPLNNIQYELGALKVSALLDEKILELPESLGINPEVLSEKTKEILNKSNHIFVSDNEYIHIIDDGEASCLALSLILNEKGIESAIAIDERTTRMLGEKPDNLHKLFERKFHSSIIMKKENMPPIQKIRFIRSSELAYVGWKKGLVKLKNGKVLDALLYATKFKGSAISKEEIEEIKKL